MMRSLARLLGDEFSGFVLENEPLSRHTTIRIGGPAAFFIEADDLRSLTFACDACRKLGVPWTMFGKGSNLLVSDAGFNGAVITLGAGFAKCAFDAEAGVFTLGAGLRLSQAVREAASLGRSGLEFAVGIPGTVGSHERRHAPRVLGPAYRLGHHAAAGGGPSPICCAGYRVELSRNIHSLR